MKARSKKEGKPRWHVVGRYTIDFCVELEADSAEEAIANVKEDPNLMMDSCRSEDVDIDDCDQVN